MNIKQHLFTLVAPFIFTTTTFANIQENLIPSHISVRDLCLVDQICFTNGTEIKIEYTIPCDSKINQFKYSSEKNGDKLNVYIFAKLSSTDNNSCKKNTTQTISLPNLFGIVSIYNVSESEI